MMLTIMRRQLQSLHTPISQPFSLQIDTMLRILSDTQLFIKTINAVFKFRYNRACLVYECIAFLNVYMYLCPGFKPQWSANYESMARVER